MGRAAANGCMLLKFARFPMKSDWDAMAGVRALRRDIARRRWAEPSVDQMVIFIRRLRLARMRSCFRIIDAAADLRDFAIRYSTRSST
jgi:hypothetical protein